ncbi:MAG TPA: TSCPD domain-containing protein, partial [Candidatus Coatesbacteria bacterium]|nr:TSCPD domain-containing protein [Candidatus Coatesbacteria bacterium]
GDTHEIDWDKLARTVHDAVHFLDNVIDLNCYPLEEIAEKTKANRKIGLGVMGFTDMLVRLWVPYNSAEAVKIAGEVMAFIQSEAAEASGKLAERRGLFPNYPHSSFAREKGPKLRNAALTTIAPTGSISIIAGCSSGIEPYFALAFYRRVLDDDRLPEVNPLFREAAEKRGFASEELFRKVAERGSVSELDEVPEEVRRIFVTAHEIEPADHIRIQAAFQQHVDAAVSKTINFPKSATEDQIAEAYRLAYELGCKGITVYRDGSRESQVLNVGREEKKAEQKPREPRPRPMVTQGRTIKMTTGCGTLYVTINEDAEGLCEVFAQMGKAGGCEASQSEAVSRLISTSIRAGVDVNIIVNQLRGIRCPSPIWHGGEQILSCPDAIARAIQYYLDPEKHGFGGRASRQMTFEALGVNAQEEPSGGNNGGEQKLMFPLKSACPDCHGQLYFAEGCLLCPACGYSKCS